VTLTALIRIVLMLAAGALNYAFPEAYKHAYDRLSRLYKEVPSLMQGLPFHSSIYPACTFHFGPQSVSCTQQDMPGFPRAMSALGDFDDVRGGHLVLVDHDLAIQFPSGTSIVISSTTRYRIAAVSAGEHHYTLTQYFPTSLVNYIERNGMPTEDADGNQSDQEEAVLDDQ
jgi:hypothetical protein